MAKLDNKEQPTTNDNGQQQRSTATGNGDGSTANPPLQSFVRLLSPPEKLEKLETLEKLSTSVSAERQIECDFVGCTFSPIDRPRSSQNIPGKSRAPCKTGMTTMPSPCGR